VSQKLNHALESDHKKYVPYISLDYNLFFLIALTQTAMLKARQVEVRRYGLTPTEFHLLLATKGLGKAAIPAEISRLLMRRPPTTTALLHRMERNGLVRRRADAVNKKVKRVVMTKKGKEALRQTLEHDVMPKIVGTLSPREFEQLWTLLEKVKARALSLAEAMIAEDEEAAKHEDHVNSSVFTPPAQSASSPRRRQNKHTP